MWTAEIRRPGLLFGGLALGASAWLALAAPAAAQSGSFTEEEARKLRAGELVVRRETRQHGELRLVGGTSLQVINLPPDTVWRALLDVRAYRHFLPSVERTRVVESRANRRVLHVRHAQGPVTADYHVAITYLPRQHMAELRVDPTRPGSIRAGWGFFSVKPYGRERAIVTWGVMADIGEGVITGLVRPRVHEWMLRVPEELKRYIEGWGRSRYETGS